MADESSPTENQGEADIVTRLNLACVGYPHALIAWPHRLLHDARAEIERLRAVVRVNALRWNPGISHEEIDRVINGQ